MAWYDNSWGYRLAVTVQSSKVPGDLTDFPVYVDLADIGAAHGFWSNVKSDGGDIRITKSDETTEVAREVVAIDTTGKTGEVHFIADGTLSSSSNTTFYLYYGNGAASEPAVTDTYGAQNVWTSSYVMVHHLEGTGYTDIDDSTDQDNDATGASGGTSFNQSSQVGKGVVVDGVNDDINFGTVSGFNFGTGNFSLSAWLYYEGSSQGIVLGKDKFGSRELLFIVNADGGDLTANKIQISYFNTLAQNIYLWSDADPISENTWHLVHVERSGNSFNIYVDGTLKKSGTTGGTHGTKANISSDLYLARREYSGFEQYFDGKLDEVRAASTDRSTDWITTEYNNQSSPSTFYTIGAEESAPAGGTPALIIID